MPPTPIDAAYAKGLGKQKMMPNDMTAMASQLNLKS
jgi:hypothetical protein